MNLLVYEYAMREGVIVRERPAYGAGDVFTRGDLSELVGAGRPSATVAGTADAPSRWVVPLLNM